MKSINTLNNMPGQQKKVLRIFLVSFLILNTYTTSFPQQNMAGGSLVYNLHTRSLGLGLRAEFPIEKADFLEGISLVPQLTYYPPFNRIHEFYLGTSVHLGVYRIDRWKFYTLANVSYNGWINNDSTQYREGNFSNLGIEVGIGVSATVKKCLHPFFEFRYNFKWNDPTLSLGILYTLKCERRGMVPCSKIPPQPIFEK